MAEVELLLKMGISIKELGTKEKPMGQAYSWI